MIELDPQERLLAEKRLLLLEQQRPDVVTLAVLVSVAVRAERELIRRLRLRLGFRIPSALPMTVATEAALWFSPFVESRGPEGITLLPAYANLLRERLTKWPQLLADVWLEVQQCHKESPPVVRWEEEIVRQSLMIEASSDQAPPIDQTVLEAVKAIATGEREGLQEWIADMWLRLPHVARRNPLLRRLRDVSYARIRHLDPNETRSRTDQWRLDYSDAEAVILDVRETGDVVQIGYLIGGGAGALKVPAIFPITLEVTDPSKTSDDPLYTRRVTIPHEGFVEVRGQARHLRITAVDGQTYVLPSEFSSEPTVTPTSSELNDRLMLDCTEQHLTTIPEHIFERKELQSLTLANNRLTTLDPRLESLENLMFLDISGNLLTVLPEFLGKMARLETLLANNNRIAAVSPQLAQARRLRALYLSGNRVQSLPDELGEMPQFQHLQIDGNPLREFPADLRQQDGNAILQYLRDKRSPVEGTRYISAKVVLLGDSDAGKTALTMRLTGGQFESRTTATHGVNVYPIEFPEYGDGIRREVMLWDFPGQRDYRLLQRLFLDDISLAMIVFEPTRNSSDTIQSWTKILVESTGPSPPKILILSRIDRGSSPFNLQEFAKGFDAVVETSAKTGEGIDQLRSQIFQSIRWDELPIITTSNAIQSIRNAIQQLKQSTRHVLISIEELSKLLVDIGVSEPQPHEIRTALPTLARTNLIYLFEDRELVLLLPELLNDYASGVFRAARDDPQGTGTIREQDILSGKLRLDTDRLPESQERVLVEEIVRLMIERSICLRLSSPDGNVLVFPAAVRIEAPSVPDGKHIRIAYRFTGSTETVFAAMVARLAGTGGFKIRQLWLNAAEFDLPGDRAARIFVSDTVNTELRLSLAFTDSSNSDSDLLFVQSVEDFLNVHVGNFDRQRWYVCPNCGSTQSEVAARLRAERGMPDLICHVCETRIPLVDELELRANSPRPDDGIPQPSEQTAPSHESVELLNHVRNVAEDAGWTFRADVEEFDAVLEHPRSVPVYVQTGPAPWYSIDKRRKQFHIKVTDPKAVNRPDPIMVAYRDSTGTPLWIDVRQPDAPVRGERIDKSSLARFTSSIRQVRAPKRRSTPAKKAARKVASQKATKKASKTTVAKAVSKKKKSPQK